MRAVTPSSRQISWVTSPFSTFSTDGAGEAHRVARACWQRPDGHVVKGVAGVGGAALPLSDDVVASGDQLGGCPEGEIGEGGSELRGELVHLIAAAAGGVQRVLKADLRSGQLVDDRWVVVGDPQNFREPAPYDCVFSSWTCVTSLVGCLIELRRSWTTPTIAMVRVAAV